MIKYFLPFALLVCAATMICTGGLSLLAPDTNLPWNPSNSRTYLTVALLIIGVTTGVLGLGVLSSRQRAY